MKTMRILSAVMIVSSLVACRSVYYGTMEQFGVEKRDIMVSRVESAQEEQQKARDQFVSALESFKTLVGVEGGDLEKTYNQLKGSLDRSETRAKAVTDRIDAVEKVAGDLFREWEKELEQYSSEDLRRRSQEKMSATKKHSDQMIAAMRKAESRLEPVLKAFRDQVMFLKHNLNALAIGSLRGEVGKIEAEVSSLVKDMDAAIREASSFVNAMRSGTP